MIENCISKITKLKIPFEPVRLDVRDPDLSEVLVSQRAEEHSLKDRAGDGQDKLVSLK